MASLPDQQPRPVIEASGIRPEIDNVNVKAFDGLISPSVLSGTIPESEESKKCIVDSRNAISRILKGDDKRLFIIMGPCSIHDFCSATEYASRLKGLREKYGKYLEIVMRVYFEKPRTTVGWKGFINDPDLNGSNKVNKGLLLGRLLLSQITNMGVPTACEFLESFTPQYIGNFVSYAAIGARTTACPLHQKLSSGLSMPVGIKNLTDGDIEGAADACVVATKPQSFLGITRNGMPAYVKTSGNMDSHIILRGGSDGPNYSTEHIELAGQLMEKKNVKPNIVVDTSHANSQKKHKNQLKVVDSICNTIEDGKGQNIVGLMIESHLKEGNQNLDHAIDKCSAADIDLESKPLTLEQMQANMSTQDTSVLNHLEYGQSITDACISWDDTEVVIKQLAECVKKNRF